MQTPATVVRAAQLTKPVKNVLQKAAAPNSPPSLPEWFQQVEKEAISAASKSEKVRGVVAAEVSPKPDNSVGYTLFLGAAMPMFSSAQQEAKLRSMHVVNHRELRIAKLAARVTDFLWPNCQEDIDQAIADHKHASAGQRVMIPEEEYYTPPEVPHFLPFTSWLRNSKELRESFVCDRSTTYKPRLSWYNPNDGMVPSGWLSEGLLADLAYYRPFTGTRRKEQAW